MRRVHLIPIPLIAVLACSTEPGGDISGTWNFSEARAAETGFTCEVNGQMLLDQGSTGSHFIGGISRVASCDGDPEGFEATLTNYQNIQKGDISGLTVKFFIDFCDYEGTLDEPEMTGTLDCEIDIMGESVDFTGTWQAIRN